MIREEKNIRQYPEEPPRRWFADDFFDLIVWFEKDGSPWGFQLCYDRERKPRALSWTKKDGYKHAGIDDGDTAGGGHKSSPVLAQDGNFDTKTTGSRFEEASREMPPEIRAFVLEKVKAFNI